MMLADERNGWATSLAGAVLPLIRVPANLDDVSRHCLPCRVVDSAVSSGWRSAHRAPRRSDSSYGFADETLHRSCQAAIWFSTWC